MSFAFTTDQVRQQTKTVTRRRRWTCLKIGDLVQPVVKVMGLKKGERIEKIGGPIRIVSVRREPLQMMLTPNYGAQELQREGGRWATGQEFINAFRIGSSCSKDIDVTRIEFEYVPEEIPL